MVLLLVYSIFFNVRRYPFGDLMQGSSFAHTPSQGGQPDHHLNKSLPILGDVNAENIRKPFVCALWVRPSGSSSMELFFRVKDFAWGGL